MAWAEMVGFMRGQGNSFHPPLSSLTFGTITGTVAKDRLRIRTRITCPGCKTPQVRRLLAKRKRPRVRFACRVCKQRYPVADWKIDNLDPIELFP